MVEIIPEELAVIFEVEIDNDGFEEEIPVDIVEGYYNEDDQRFVDTKLYTYSHLTKLEEGKAFALRYNISELLTKFPDKSLNEIKHILFDKYKKNSYSIEYFKEEPVIVMFDAETGKRSVLLDKDTAESLMFLYNDKELEDMMLSLETKDEEASKTTKVEKEIVSQTETTKNKELNPHKLYKEIRKTVKGQDEAIKKIVTVIWENYSNDNKSANNMIVLGSSGVGKTEIFRQLSKILDIPLFIFGSAGMSQAGYKGTGTDEILSNLIAFTKGDVEKAERAIVILDEFDKIAYKGVESGSVSTDGVQNELLKIVEDGTFVVKIYEHGLPVSKTINTSHITFVGVGAFTEILNIKKEKSLGFGSNLTTKEIAKDKIKPEELIKFGIKKELVGRMSEGGIIKLNDIDLNTIKEIITNSSNSPYLHKIRVIEKIIPKFIRNNEEEIIEEIAKTVINNKDNLGVREVYNIIGTMFSNILFDISDPDENYQELEISKETVNDPKRYILRK